ncbi:MAG: hypothetical protein SVV03_01580, partial [Candidatus Nanohaloarchaea archaeon]|nr:hypothetical protein [Candidatus Nanohaloarchaea archaeon]
MGESEEYEAVYRFVQDSRINAIISWILVVFLAASILHHAFTYQPSWALISLLVLSLVVVPPVSKWDLEKMIPWEILLLATLPLMGHALGVNLPASSLFYYISVASTALIITVELHMFTDIKMADWFIVLFIATSTLAVSAIWVIIRWFLGP